MTSVSTAEMRVRQSGLANSWTGKVVSVCADKTAVRSLSLRANPGSLGTSRGLSKGGSR